jgi:hypothetical protein
MGVLKRADRIKMEEKELQDGFPLRSKAPS